MRGDSASFGSDIDTRVSSTADYFCEIETHRWFRQTRILFAPPSQFPRVASNAVAQNLLLRISVRTTISN